MSGGWLPTIFGTTTLLPNRIACSIIGNVCISVGIDRNTDMHDAEMYSGRAINWLNRSSWEEEEKEELEDSHAGVADDKKSCLRPSLTLTRRAALEDAIAILIEYLL